jgi:hypothetical protein
LKKLILQVEDQAFEKLMGLMELCPSVTVESAYDSDSIQNQTDQCFASALSGMINANEFKSVSDYAYIMQLTIEDHLKCGTLFVNPDEFISYLKLLGFQDVPSRSSLYRILNTIVGTYPNWRFTDDPTGYEELRRKNIARLFLSAFCRCKRQS